MTPVISPPKTPTVAVTCRWGALYAPEGTMAPRRNANVGDSDNFSWRFDCATIRIDILDPDSNSTRRRDATVTPETDRFTIQGALDRVPSVQFYAAAFGSTATVSQNQGVEAWNDSDRYHTPETSVSDRIDELILDESGSEDLLLNRRRQADWLKQVMALYWREHWPQPYVAFDLEEGLFTASWQSDEECNTLTIDAGLRKGWYDPWPDDDMDNPLPGEIDLDTEEAWERLRIALMEIR